MRSVIPSRTGFLLLMLCAALPAAADTQFRARKMTRGDVPRGKGQCDIRLQVDGEVEVTVREDFVYVRNFAGRGARDDGSECNQPLPHRPVEDFHFEVLDGRGEIRLTSEPTRQTNFEAVVHIRDTASGEGRYHFRLRWAIPPEGAFPGRGRLDDTDERPGGLTWNNTIHFGGRGTGTYGPERLSDANVDIDRGGRILVAFRTQDRRSVSFSGVVVESDRETIKADVASDDPARLRGSMYLSRNARGDVSRITLEATNGQDRLRLEWNRR